MRAMILDEHDSSAMNSRKRVDFAWVIVGVSFMTLGLTYGFMYCFSVFFVALLKEFHWSRSLGAGAYSLFLIVSHLVGPLVGRMVDHFGPRRVIFLGCLVVALGITLSSLIQTWWQFYLFFGVVTAVGIAGTGWVTNTTLIHYWFREKRGLPMGIISAGIGFGVLLCVPMAQFFIDRVGWRVTYRIMASAIPGVIALMAILFLRRPPQFSSSGLANQEIQSSKPKNHIAVSQELTRSAVPSSVFENGVKEHGSGSTLSKFRPSGPGVEGLTSPRWTIRQVMSIRQFWILFFAFLLGNLCIHTMVTHQVAFFVDRGTDALHASYFVGLVGFASMGAKIFLGVLSDRVGRKGAYIVGISVGVCGVLSLIVFNYSPSSILPYVYAFFFAMGYAATAVLPPVITGDLSEGKAFARVFGTLTIANGLGAALGAWVAGFIHDQVKSYLPAFVLVIACFLLSAYLIGKATTQEVKEVSAIR